MKAYSPYNDHERDMLGLPALATAEDINQSVETSGVKTDYIKALAEKVLGVEYCFVTPQQRANIYRGYQRGYF